MTTRKRDAVGRTRGRSGANERRGGDALDIEHMQRCLELARKGAGRTSPNPMVGCVIVDQAGTVIAEGYHRGPGKAHAEVDALAKLGGKAPGATLYVNLEPCTHFGRTPPCAPAVAASGVTRVVVGSEDPVPGHGGGIQQLRRKGISVRVGVCQRDCDRLNIGFLTASTRQRPAFILKAAMTMDGKIATVAGQSKWITGDDARATVMQLRNQYDAIMVGIGTVLADDPWLNCHAIPGLRDPHRIVLDSQLRTPPTAHLMPRTVAAGPQVIIACGPKASEAKQKVLEKKGAAVIRCRVHRNGQIDVTDLGNELHRRGIQSVLVEGGAEVHAYMLDHDLGDLLYLYMAPVIVGGPAKSWVGGKGHATLAGAHHWQWDDQPWQFGQDYLFTAIRKGAA